jgi:L,D-transpeptidase YbiS
MGTISKVFARCELTPPAAGLILARMTRAITAFECRRRQLGIFPTRFLLVATVARQELALLSVETRGCPALPIHSKIGGRRYHLLQTFRCSTSRFGVGQIANSNCTPLGLHCIREKIGGGHPVGTVFQGRRPIGFTWQGMPDAKITTRILWLEGLEPGFNRGGNVDSHARYIYIHGTGDEPSLGRPASCGCIHLAADDLIPLFDRLPSGTLVWIQG